MPKIKPLTPEQAKKTIAHRFSARADRLRQLNTRFGVRSSRIQLVWVKWTGEEKGEGEAQIIAEMELLPTPFIQAPEQISMRLYASGTLPVGTIRVGEVSALYTEDQLTGAFIPKPSFLAAHNPPTLESAAAVSATPHEYSIEDPTVEFFYEVFEDGRGDNPSERSRYRLSTRPARNPENLEWVLVLERMSEDRSRTGEVENG